jgi:hypothetical protein
MDSDCFVTATISNNTAYKLDFDNDSTTWGSFNNTETTISPHSQQEVFTAVGAAGSGTGCQGSATYTFTDQYNHSQDVTLFYKDPYIGSNAFSATAPAGITITNDGPAHGDTVPVTYSISGSIP